MLPALHRSIALNKAPLGYTLELFLVTQMGPYLVVPTLSASLWIWFDRQAGSVEWAKHQEQRCVRQQVKLSYITFDGSEPSDLHFQVNLSGTLSLDVKSDLYPNNALASLECAHHFAFSPASTLSSNAAPPQRLPTGLPREHPQANLENTFCFTFP